MSTTVHHQVNGILEQFAAQVGLSSCELDEDAGLQFALDDILISLPLDEEKSALLLLSLLGQPAATAELYGQLLDVNFFWSKSGGATLARDSASRAIVLQQPLAVEGLDFPAFERTPQQFVNAADEEEDENVEDGEDDQVAPARLQPEGGLIRG